MRSPRTATALLWLLLAATAATASQDCAPLFKDSPPEKVISERAWSGVANSKLQLSSMGQAAFLLVAPTSEKAFANAFGTSHTATVKNLRSMQLLARNARKKGFQAYSEASQGAKDVRAILGDPAIKLVVIAGHNENGKLALPDGSKLSIQNVLARSSGEKLVIVIACNVKDEAPYIEGLVDNAIKATDALQALTYYADQAKETIATGKAVTYQAFVNAKNGQRRTVIRLNVGGLTRFFRGTVEVAGRATIVTINGPCQPSSPECRRAANATT